MAVQPLHNQKSITMQISLLRKPSENSILSQLLATTLGVGESKTATVRERIFYVVAGRCLKKRVLERCKKTEPFEIIREVFWPRCKVDDWEWVSF